MVDIDGTAYSRIYQNDNTLNLEAGNDGTASSDIRFVTATSSGSGTLNMTLNTSENILWMKTRCAYTLQVDDNIILSTTFFSTPTTNQLGSIINTITMSPAQNMTSFSNVTVYTFTFNKGVYNVICQIGFRCLVACSTVCRYEYCINQTTGMLGFHTEKQTVPNAGAGEAFYHKTSRILTVTADNTTFRANLKLIFGQGQFEYGGDASQLGYNSLQAVRIG